MTWALTAKVAFAVWADAASAQNSVRQPAASAVRIDKSPDTRASMRMNSQPKAVFVNDLSDCIVNEPIPEGLLADTIGFSKPSWARSLKAGFGCDVIAHDLVHELDLVALGVRYVEREMLFSEAEIITLHGPLTPGTRHVVDARSLAPSRSGVVIINTSREP